MHSVLGFLKGVFRFCHLLGKESKKTCIVCTVVCVDTGTRKYSRGMGKYTKSLEVLEVGTSFSSIIAKEKEVAATGYILLHFILSNFGLFLVFKTSPPYVFVFYLTQHL